MPKVLKKKFRVFAISQERIEFYEVDVLNADKHESLLQVDSIIFDGFGQACPN